MFSANEATLSYRGLSFPINTYVASLIQIRPPNDTISHFYTGILGDRLIKFQRPTYAYEDYSYEKMVRVEGQDMLRNHTVKGGFVLLNYTVDSLVPLPSASSDTPFRSFIGTKTVS